MLQADARVSVAEAAFLAGLPVRAIDHEIDARIVRSSGKKNARAVSVGDLVYLRAVGKFRREMAPSLRKQLRNAIADAIAERKRVAKLGLLTVPVDDLAQALRADLRWLERVRSEFVESRSTIMGGDPVLAGTRVPVRLVADLMKKGTSLAQIQEELDLSEEQIEAAVTYDSATPRRGRPRLNRRDVVPHVPADR
jgi:uncharacterized protein (DUF433 family)